MSVTKRFLLIITCFIVGILCYVLGVQLTFSLTDRILRDESIELLLLTSIGGCAILGLGYLSSVFIGGKVSLTIMEFFSKITGSKQIIEETDNNSSLTFRFLKIDFSIFIPIILFITSMALDWDIHNVHSSETGIVNQLLAYLDIFSKPPSISAYAYSISTIPIMILLFAIIGIIPAIALPYFRKFKITSVNGGQFPSSLLFTFVGTISGLGVLFSLTGFFYNTLWVNKGPVYYHYILPALVGLSLHYSIGLFLGRKKSELLVSEALPNLKSERIIIGSIKILKDEKVQITELEAVPETASDKN